MLNGIYTCMFILYITCQLVESRLFSVNKVSIGHIIALQLQQVSPVKSASIKGDTV